MVFKKKIDYSMINPSSKMSLKLSCLRSVGGDVKKAEEMYNFLSAGIDTIPDFPISQPTMIQQIQQTAGNIVGWFKENQGDIVNAWNFIQQMRGGQPLTPPADAAPIDIPPLPKIK